MGLLTLKIADFDLLTLMDAANGHGLWAGTFQVHHMAEHRASAEFTLLTQMVIFVPQFGQKVEALDSDGQTKIFSGTIDQVTQRMRDNGSDLEVSCLCTDWAQVLETLYMDAVFTPVPVFIRDAETGVVTTSVIPLTVNGIVTRMFQEEFAPCPKLSEEGFTIAELGVGAEFTEPVILDRKSVWQALRDFAELSVDEDGNSYAVWVDADKGIHLVPRKLGTAPFNITETNKAFALGTFELVDTRKDYATEVFLRFGGGVTEEAIEFTGDNVSKTFPRSGVDPLDPVIKPMRELVRVSLNGEDKSIAPEPESSSPGADWYWQPGGTSIREGEAGSLGGIAISSTDKLDVVYRAFGSDLIGAVNDDQVKRYGALGAVVSGKLQTVIERTEMTDAALIQQTVVRLKDKISVPGRTISYKTYKPGLLPGQLQKVQLDSHNLNDEEFIIDQVNIQDENKTRLVYSVTAYAVERIRNAVDFFQSLVGTGGGALVAGGGGSLPEYVFIEAGSLRSGTDIGTHHPIMQTCTLTEWAATFKTGSGTAILDVRRNGVSIFDATDRPTIPAGSSPSVAVKGMKFKTATLNVGDMLTWDCIAGGGLAAVTLKLKGI